jgi:hypothetical protein
MPKVLDEYQLTFSVKGFVRITKDDRELSLRLLRVELVALTHHFQLYNCNKVIGILGNLNRSQSRLIRLNMSEAK